VTFEMEKDTWAEVTEEAQYTVLSSLGTLGGFYSIAAGIYVLLFGSEKLSAFGLVQTWRRPRLRRRLDQAFPGLRNLDHTNEEANESVSLPVSSTMDLTTPLTAMHVMAIVDARMAAHMRKTVAQDAFFREYYLNTDVIDEPIKSTTVPGNTK